MMRELYGDMIVQTVKSKQERKQIAQCAPMTAMESEESLAGIEIASKGVDRRAANHATY